MKNPLDNVIYENNTFKESGTWFSGTYLPDRSSASISAVVFKGDLYVFIQHYGSIDNGKVDYLIFQRTPSGQLENTVKRTIPHIYVTGTPAVAVYDNKIYCAFRLGGASQKLTYTTFDGSAWSSVITTKKGILTSPSLAVYQDKLYCFHQGWEEDRGTLWYSTFNGSDWDQDKHIRGLEITESPTVAVYKGELYCAYHKASTQSAWCIKFDGMQWSHKMSLSAAVSESPSLYVYNDSLFSARTVKAEHASLCINYLDNGTWCPDKTIVNDGISNSPCLIEYEGLLYCFYRNKDHTLSYAFQHYQTLNRSIPLLDVWGEGRIHAGEQVSGFNTAVNLNLYKQSVSNGLNRYSAIPNIMPVATYDDPDFPIACEQVKIVTLMGAPITERVADEIGRVLDIEGRVFLFAPDDKEREMFQIRNKFRLKPISTATLPAPIDQISKDFHPVYAYEKYRN
jgi:hypothetical protein